ncbi:MAG: hypothetical protein WAQ75_10395, partial [Propionicimonas sp.]
MAVVMGADRFDELVWEALEGIPSRLLALVENCAVIIEDEPEPDEPELFGYYDGIPLSERDSQYG